MTQAQHIMILSQRFIVLLGLFFFYCNQYLLYMNLDFRCRVARFYPYESVFLVNRMIETETHEEYNQFVKMIEAELGFNLTKATYKEVGFKNYCRLDWDNKVTFQILAHDQVLYIQFYDGKATIGSSLMKRNYDPETHYLEVLY